MTLTTLTFENYKSFRKRETIELRPLTILIGRNSSGKSVIARLPLLLAHSLSERAESPLDFEFSGLDFGTSFADIVHGRIPHGSLGIGAHFKTADNKSIRIFAKIQHFDEYKLQVVQRFELEKSDAPPITLLWIGKDPLEDLEQYYFDEANCEASIRFRGICPDKISLSDKEQEQTDMSEYLSDLLDDPKKVFGSFLNEINYLGPFREEPSRIYRFSGGLFRDVGIRGEKAPGLLNDDKIRRKGEVLSAVGSWFSEHLGGWPLDLSSQGDYFSLILRNPKNPSVEVNITDVGNGIAQVLPVVVQRQFANMAGEKRGLEIVEHPELHLHPGAHGAIADLYATAVKTSGMRCLIETHSENFVLRIRRRIADRTLHPDDVIIYWIKDEADSDTRIQRINIDADGEADHWPAGVFSEDFDEVRAIRDAQKRHHR